MDKLIEDVLEPVEEWWTNFFRRKEWDMDLAREELDQALAESKARVAVIEAESLAREEKHCNGADALSFKTLECIAKVETRCAVLEDVLEELMNWQNGPPLITYTEGWTETMEKAANLLEKKNTEVDSDGGSETD